MASCEKCWNDACLRMRMTGKSQHECYYELLNERKDNPCSEKERAGQFWDEQKGIDKRFQNKQQ